MKNWLSFVDVIAPPSCMSCGGTLESSASLLCMRCMVQLPVSVRPLRTVPFVRSCWAWGPYAGVLGSLIRKAKYGRCIPVADQLGLWLGERMAGLVSVDVVTHVPTPWFRRMYRGFDPSSRIADGVSEHIGVAPVRLLRRRDGSRQVGKSARDRLSLCANAFEALPRSFPKRVLLIDDVVTTGATLRAAAMCLRRQGVRDIDVALVAHT